MQADDIPRIGPGYIYIIRCQQYYKIGQSDDPKRRAVNVQINNPFPVRLIKVFSTRRMLAAENYIHARVAPYRERGEWFMLPRDVLAELLAINDLDALIPPEFMIEPDMDLASLLPSIPEQELTWALAAVRLKMSGAERTKEGAILRAFPHVTSKGNSPAWRRASALYDVVAEAQKSGEAAGAPAPAPIAETA